MAPNITDEVPHEERPWGRWEILDMGVGYKTKNIWVTPHSRLSYQTHQHRAEHWFVVSGIATCVVDGREIVLRPGESLDIAIRQPHRITNQHDDLLHIVEVQQGDYCGEDDIIRLEDDFGRVQEET